jgi:hypothetical protein
MTEATMSQSTEALPGWLLRSLAATGVERLGIMVIRDDTLPENVFSLAPGSVNRLYHGKSGAIYTGREMG